MEEIEYIRPLFNSEQDSAIAMTIRDWWDYLTSHEKDEELGISRSVRHSIPNRILGNCNDGT